MGNPEEPAYRAFEGTCRECGKKHTYYNSVRRHPDYHICRECEDVQIIETLTGEKVSIGVIKGSG